LCSHVVGWWTTVATAEVTGEGTTDYGWVCEADLLKRNNSPVLVDLVDGLQ
jgi:hypothetical protein